MEETYLTVKELAELKGCTERYVRKLIVECKIYAIVTTGLGTGQGGMQYKIPLSTLEIRLQMKFKRRLKEAEKLKKKEVELVLEEKPPILLENLSAKERNQIVFWHKILDEWRMYRNNYSGAKTDADCDFICLANEKYQDISLNRRTLYRKQQAFQISGEFGLLDKRGKHDKHVKKLTDEVWDVFEYYYLDQSQKRIRLCMTLTELNFKSQGRMDLLPLPSETTFARRIKDLPIPIVKYFRYSEKNFIGECAPYIKRIYDDLESNDIWVADNHTFDIMVCKDGSPLRVYLTAFMDVRSRKFTGWCITDAPSSDATVYALKKGCEHHGVPKALYTDNGREFLFHDLGGNGFRKRKKDEAIKLPSILDELGIEFKTALPRNARAKGIERAFDTVKENFSKLFESYTGGTILEKPDKLKQVVKDSKRMPAIEEFISFVDTYIQGCYNKAPHTGVGMNGKSPDFVFAKNLIEKRVIPKNKLDFMFMRYAKGNKGTLKVGKNGISLKFYGQELQFFDEELWKLYFGREVYVRYSPDDLSSVRVFDTGMKFICTAKLKTELGYRATKTDVAEQQQSNRNAVKAVKAYKKQKNIEAENELKLILDEAARNMDDFGVVNTKHITLISGSSEQALKRVSGDDGVVIDWQKGLERLKRVKEEG